MLLASLCAALCAAPQSAPSSLSPTAKDLLGPSFTRAAKDPAGVVPLILQASWLLDGSPGERDVPKLSAEEARALSDTLEPFCRRAFFSPERLPSMQKIGLLTHTVRSGEVGERIAKRYRMGTGMLARLNEGFEPTKLREGQELKVLDLTDDRLEVTVSKGLYRLAAWRRLEGGRRALVLYVPVGLGAADTPTPEGKTSIVSRVRDPEWTDPVTKEVYKPGDPKNVLGGFWIALDPEGIGKSGIGLHGFTGEAAANWIEQPASHGCVRMLQADIDRFYDLAIEGTAVAIRP